MPAHVSMESDAHAMTERQHQTQAVEAALSSCRNGRGGLLFVEGWFGTGKTSLLTAAQERAAVRGFIVLQAHGSEFEKEFRYGVVRQLFEPWLASASPEERAAALAGPAALAAPLFAGHAGTAADDEPAVLRGLHWLLLNLAAVRPVLMTLDDLHWADRPSQDFLHYLESRLERHPVLGCAAVPALPATAQARTGGPAHVWPPLPTTRWLTTGPLGTDGTRQVLAAALGAEPLPELIAACREATGGNPFLLRELAAELARDAEACTAPGPVHVARAGPRGVARAVPRWIRLAGPHAEAATALVQALAVLGPSADPTHLARLAGLTPATATDAASALMDIGVLRPQGPPRFGVPLLGRAVHEHLPHAVRQRAHADAARILGRDDTPAERIARHLLHTPPSGDRRDAGILTTAGRSALREGDAAHAVALYRRAARDGAAAPALLAELGTAELTARDTRAAQTLRDALEATDDTRARAPIALRLGVALAAAGRHDEALKTLRCAHEDIGDQTGDQIAGRGGEVTRRLHSEIVSLALFTPGARGLAGPPRDPHPAHRAVRALLDGEPAPRVARWCERAVASGAQVHGPDGVTQASWLIAYCLLWCDRTAEAGAVLDDGIRQAESQRLGPTADALRSLRAFLHLRRGSLERAEHDADAVLARATPGDIPPQETAFALAARVEAHLLRDDTRAAVRLAQRYGVDDRVPLHPHYLPLLTSRGRLRAATGDPARGAVDLVRTAGLLREWGARTPALGGWSEAIHALTTLGRHDEAHRMAAGHLSAARDFGAPRVVAAALRAHARAASAASSSSAVDSLDEALHLLQASSAPVERCRALLQSGVALRDAGRPAPARRRLREADELADATGADALRKRARRELAAMGIRVRASARTGVTGLTPQERRVSVLAAQGKRNQEIARALFVTVKTVEWHLSQVYRKLGIASRAELWQALAPSGQHKGEATTAARSPGP
jgi:DNA-binding NarL/FixJ family response regulator